MSALLQRFLNQAFDIREGEVQRATLMQLNIFLLISTLLVVKPTVNGLFLSEIGVEYLPGVFVLVAVFAVIVSTIYARFLSRSNLHQIIQITLGSSVGLFILFAVLLRLNIVGGWILYAFYIWVAVFGVLTASQFWILANMVFNVREAKRLFGFIGAGAIAGGIFGGYLTTLLAERIGSENLVFVGAGMLLLCIPITRFIWKKHVAATQSNFQRRKKIKNTDHPISLIRQSPHLSYLAGIIGISVLVAKLVDFQFSAIASYRITDPDELTAFFGLWFSNFNLLSLAVQLLLTRRIVGTLGIGSSLLFLPAAIFLGAVMVFIFPELWAAVFIKMSDGSLKQSVNKAAVELLALPIPSEIKNQTKTFIDVVVDSIATGIGGLILIFVVNGLNLSTQSISVIIVLLIGVWIYFVKKVRSTYLDAFRSNLKQFQSEQQNQLDLANASVVGDLKKVLASGSEQQILFVLKKLKIQPDERFFDALTPLLQHPSPLVLEGAIRALYFLKGHHLLSQIIPLTKHPSQKVKIAAFDYLIAHSAKKASLFMEKNLIDEDYRVRGAALVSLAQESRDNLVLKEKFGLATRLENSYRELQQAPAGPKRDFQMIGLLKALGLAKLPHLFPLVEAAMTDDNPKVAGAALLAAGATMHPHFLPELIQQLADPVVTTAAQQAILQYGPGVIPVLKAYVQSPQAYRNVLYAIPPILEKLNDQASADLLFSLLENKEAKVRQAALAALNRLKANHSYLNYHTKELPQHILEEARLFQDTLSILYVQRKATNPNPSLSIVRQDLIRLLENRLDANLERIFRLLGLKYPPQDVNFIFENIQSQQPSLRVNALEYLDNLLEPDLKKVLIPIVETALLDTITETAIRDLKLKIPNERECYQLLLEGGDEEIKEKVQLLMGNK